MINQTTVDLILREIAELEREFQSCQGLILTEDDMKCHLFSRIKNAVDERRPSLNPETIANALHSEVKFFDEEDMLTLRPDLCIIDPKYLSIYHSVEFAVTKKRAAFKKYSSKNFEIGGSAILIELKFCREQSGINDANIQEYKTDLEKLMQLQSIVNERSNGHDKIYGIFVIFNKTNAGKEKFDTLSQQYVNSTGISMYYGTGNVDFSCKNPNLYDTGFVPKHYSTA